MTDSQTVYIDKLVYGGAGLGRIDGKVCFVPFTAPGDIVAVEINGNKKSYLTASIEKIVSKAQCRITPPCPIFMECGGCNWQHIDYDTQLDYKKQILAEMLYSKGKISPELIENVIPSPNEYHYRSRMQFKTRYIDNRLISGFYRLKTHWVTILPDCGCMIADNQINQALRSLTHFAESLSFTSKIPQIDISVDESGSVHALIHFAGDMPETLDAELTGNENYLKNISSLSFQSGRKSSIRSIFSAREFNYSVETDREYTLKVRSGGFSQVNFHQNKKLVTLVRDMLSLSPVSHLLDLYCGNGNLSIPSATLAFSLTGVEEYEGSIADAVENAKSNNIDKAEWIAGSVTEVLSKLVKEGKTFDTAIIDPPRSGALDAVKPIFELGIRRIIYVSCDPPTLARDAAELMKYGFRTIKVVPVDMFPQTYHLETLLYMEKC